MSESKKQPVEPQDKDAEIARLKKQLELSELKTEMLETMIDIAENDLNIEIRKKSGTNQ